MKHLLFPVVLVTRTIAQAIRHFIERVVRRIANVLDYGYVLRQWCRADFDRFFVAKRTRIPTDAEDTTTPSPLHALLIGIDRYKSDNIKDLCGAVLDANAVEEYLRTELNVPGHQIVNLHDHAATRDAILRELRALCAHETIREGDPILIYFAGHGATTKAPEGWITGRKKIPFIVPHDCLVGADNGKRVYPIQEETLGELLRELSEQKGDMDGVGNVTVILDCCHSGFPTHQLDRTTPSRFVRGLELEPEESLPSSLDEPGWSYAQKTCAMTEATGSFHPGCKSCVFLTACRESEFAQEVDRRGLFTSALLDTLRNIAVHKVSYLDLMQRIPNIPGQTPKCEGHNRHRMLFNALVRSKAHAVYRVTEEDGQLIVDAGSTQGVTRDTEFAIYPHRDFTTSEKPLAVMRPEVVRAFRAVLANLTLLSDHALGLKDSCSYFAQPLRVTLGQVETLRLHIAPRESEGFLAVSKALEKVVSQPTGVGPVVLLVDEAAHSDLGICISGGDVQYIINEPLITSCGLYRLCQTTKAEARAIHRVLSSAAYFFRVLHHPPQQTDIRDLIHVEVHALVQDEEAELGPDLRRPWAICGDNLYKSGFVDVVADDDTPYGISIINNSNLPLHVWAFYLDCSTLSVSEYYRPPAIGRGAEPSLQPQSILKIGYGAGGGLPYTFFVREDQDADVGFIKLFVTTDPVDLSNIEQSSPFRRSPSRGKRTQIEDANVGLDAFLITIVQRKP
ncbi:hypothetical protein PENSPDRAFT_692082 [Peniophora sp. CONT]|nr:hypothetical protein PENSPDRAFT_692082 [Peniophora sp. CONT]